MRIESVTRVKVQANTHLLDREVWWYQVVFFLPGDDKRYTSSHEAFGAAEAISKAKLAGIESVAGWPARKVAPSKPERSPSRVVPASGVRFPGFALSNPTVIHERSIMNIDDLTLGQFKDISLMLGKTEVQREFTVGDTVFVRTVIYHYVGRVVGETDQFVELETASWVADTGRFNNALATGELDEVEPYPFGVGISKAAIVDWSPWNHELPEGAK